MAGVGLLLFVACCGSLSAKDKAEEQGRPLLKAASEQALLHADGSSTFRVKVSFTIRASSKPFEGTYSWSFNSADDWRKELTLSDYTDVEIGRGSTVTVKRSLDYKPLPVFWVEGIFENFIYLNGANDTIDRYFTTSKDHVALRCVELKRVNKPGTVCVDPQSNVVRADAGELDLTYEYSEYQPTGNKFMPRHVIVKRDGKVILEGNIESLPVNTENASATSEPPAGAVKRFGCLAPTLPKLANKISPQYPEAARRSGEQGTVIFYVMIASDGSVHRVQLIQTVSQDLDDASQTAIERWQYEPAKCNTVPVDSEVPVTVHFSLQR